MSKARKFAKKGQNTKTALKVANKKKNQQIKSGAVKAKTKSRYEMIQSRNKKNLSKSDQRKVEPTNVNDIDVDDMMSMIPKDELKRLKRKAADVDSSSDDYDSDDVEEYEKTGARETFRKKAKVEPKPGDKSKTKRNAEGDQVSDEGQPTDENKENEQETQPPTLVELLLQKKNKFAEIKDQVGALATAIVTHPEKNILKMKSILMLLDVKDEEPSFKLAFFQVQTLVAYSLLEVFKDILPNYRVRENFGEEKGKEKPRYKKITKALQEFETHLIKFYKVYINRMERMIEGMRAPKKRTSTFYDNMLKSRTAKEKMALVGVKCLSKILVANPNFNFRDNIIQILAPLMASGNKEISDISCQTMVSLYKQDKLGEVSLACVKATGKLVKAQGLKTEPQVLRTFLSLKIKEVKNRGDNVKDMKKVREKINMMSRKEKKRNKKMQKLENQLLETEAQESQQKKLDFHTEILSHVFFIFFRLLKNVAENGYVVEESTRCLTPVLEGLSKFCHLINVDFYDDLIALLYRLVTSGNLNNSQSLSCLSTAFTVMSDEGYSLNIDPQRFYSQLYQCLLYIGNNASSNDSGRMDTDLKLMHSCIDNMILKKRKQMTMSRVLAFTKRLGTVALQAPPSAAASLICSLRLIMQNHGQCEVLTDTESFGSGTYLPELADPEYCNANATKLWEVHLLKNHCEPTTRKFAHFVLNGMKSGELASDLAKRRPFEVYEFCKFSDEEFVNSTDVPTAIRRKFHGYIFSKDSLAAKSLKALEDEAVE